VSGQRCVSSGRDTPSEYGRRAVVATVASFFACQPAATTELHALELEGDAVVTGCAEQLSVVRGSEDLDKRRLVSMDPLDGWQRSDGPLHAPARRRLFFDEDEHAGEETLEEVEEVADGGDGMAHAREERAVEDHLPLDASLPREERGGVRRNLEAHIGTAGETSGRTVRGGTFDVKE